MSAKLVQRRRLRAEPRSQVALIRALADKDEYGDTEWEDEDEGYSVDFSSLRADSSGQQAHASLVELRRKEAVGRKKHMKISRKLLEKQSNILELLGATGDPFGALPNVPGGNDHLVYHWNNVIVHPGVAGPRKDWFPFAVQHPTLFQATLFVAASSYDTVNGRKLPLLFFSHRGELIRTISSRLEDPETAATDSTIGAVAMIYMVDSMRSSKDVALTHLRGLQQLIYARGGVHMLDSRVQVMITLVDLLASTYLRQPPHFHDSRFENVTPSQLYGPISLSTDFHSQNFASRLAAFTGDNETADACASIYWGLRNLTVILDSSKSEWHEGVEFSTRAEFLERQVRNMLDGLENDSSETSPSATAVSETTSSSKTKQKPRAVGPGGVTSNKYDHSLIFTLFGTAAKIYIYSILQQLVVKLPVFPQMAKLLQDSMAIGDSNLKTLLGTFPDLMLWVLFLGGNAAPWGQKGWFAKTATRVLMVKKVEERQGVEGAATAFLFPEGKENYDATGTAPDAEDAITA